MGEGEALGGGKMTENNQARVDLNQDEMNDKIHLSVGTSSLC